METTIENVNISLNGEAPKGAIEVVLRMGEEAEPLPLRENKRIHLEGSADTVLELMKLGHLMTSDAYARVSINPKEQGYASIWLHSDPKNYYGATAQSEIEVNPVLSLFNFNSIAFDNKSFIQLIQKNAFVFSNKSVVKKLRDSLFNFQVRIETELTDTDDRSGNTDLRQKTILKREESGIPNELEITLPLLKNGDSVTIKAEVEIEIKSGKVMFGFYSSDLTVALKEAVENEVERVVKAIKSIDENLPIIYA